MKVRANSDWREAILGDLTHLEYGKSLPATKRVLGRVPVYGSNGVVGWHDRAIVKGPGIVVGRKGTAGAVEWAIDDFWPIDTTYFVGRVDQDTDLRWLYYLLKHLRLDQLNAATGIPGLNRNDALALPVSIPPLAEQRKIAAILSSVDEAMEKTQAVIDQVQVVKKGLMQTLLTRGLPSRHTRFKHTAIGEIPEEWEVVPIGVFATFVTSGSRGWAKYYSNAGALFIRSQNIRAGVLDFTDRAFVKPPESSEGRRTRVVAGDMLITITGNSVGNVAWAPAGLGEAYVSQHVGLVRLTEPQIVAFLTQYFAPGAPGNGQIIAAQYGQSKPGLNLNNLKSFLVPLPHPEERNKITEQLSSIQIRLDAEIKFKTGLEDLKQGVMSALFSGDVRVPVPVEDDFV